MERISDVSNRSAPALPALWPLYVVIFVGFIGYSLMITVFTPMLLRGDSAMMPVSATASHRTIVLGVLLCLYPLGQFLGSPVLGALSDRYGRRPVLLVSLAITTFCYVLIALALQIADLRLLGLASLIAGLAEANIVTAQSAITDLIAPDQRNRYFGYIYMSASLAYIVGPLAGGKLADPRNGSWFNDATPFWIVLVLLMLTTAAVLLLFRETKAPGTDRNSGRWWAAFASMSIVFTAPRLRRFFGVNFLMYLAIFGFFRSYPMYLVDQFHLGVSAVSEFVAWVGLPIVLANIGLTGFLSARMRVRTLTICSAALTGLCMAAIVLPPSLIALWPILFLTAASLAVCLPSCATLLSNAAEGRDQGQVMGSNQAIQVGAESLSGLVAGLLAAIVVKLPLLVLGGISLLAALLVAVAL
jgi:DHA1 family tetracycline resistance protein-like MFS transporter